MPSAKLSILGTVGVPGNYGGFETLAENLVRHHAALELDTHLTVYCSSKSFPEQRSKFYDADLRYINLYANGPQSIPYDILSLFSAVRHKSDVILLLGVSGALALPFIRLISRARILTNVDGIEWKREKWRGLARMILKWSEFAAVRWSHVVIADNTAIAEHVKASYGIKCKVIPYGGDHAVQAEPTKAPEIKLPDDFALALCRIEPENNVAMILEAFSRMPERALVFVGNWNQSDYGKDVRRTYGEHSNITLLDPVYDPGILRWIRDRTVAYIHGHSAGGTNPSLVEMMHFGIPVFAHGCTFNRFTTEESAAYFSTPEELITAVEGLDDEQARIIGTAMREIAQRRYTWEAVGRAYFELVEGI
jgi:glycosyltransferase involved in cell wall biosynthesis